MVKRICAILLIVSALLSLSACMGGGDTKTDEQSTDVAVRIESYLDKADTYFNVLDTNAVIPSVKNKEDVLKVYIEKATAKEELPKDLVNSYIESYKAYFGSEASDTSAEDSKLKDEAVSLIKSEMVIYIAADRFGCNEISKEDEVKKAKELAALYSTSESAFYTEGADNYVVKSAIREERVKAELEAAFDNANK